MRCPPSTVSIRECVCDCAAAPPASASHAAAPITIVRTPFRIVSSVRGCVGATVDFSALGAAPSAAGARLQPGIYRLIFQHLGGEIGGDPHRPRYVDYFAS